MLTDALTQLFQRAHARFGVDIEIFDTCLNRTFPETESETELDRGIRESAVIRQTLMDCVATGRAAQLAVNDEAYDAIPLNRGARRHGDVMLALVRRAAPPTAAVPEFWADFVRATIEADLVNRTAVAEERDRARRLLGTLRFLGQLVQTDSEADLAHALIQAAAVWFDADARVYQQDLHGDYVLYAALPGTVVESAARRLVLPPGADGVDLHRTSSVLLWEDQIDTDVILVALDTVAEPGSMLVLIGASVGDATQLPILGAIAGAQVDRCRGRRRDRVRQRFLDRIHNGDPESAPEQIVRDLAALTNAAHAVLTLESAGQLRTLASVGSAPARVPSAGSPRQGSGFQPTVFTCEFLLGENAKATLEMWSADGSSFSPDHAMVTRVVAELLSACLHAVWPALVGASIALADSYAAYAFLQRIDEEMERAKRFDLHLSLVVIDLPAQIGPEQSAQLQAALRSHLRGSDVLGSVGFNRMAAVLTHTAGTGSHRVVERLRRRLAESTSHLGIAGVIIGHAEFSPEFRTADTLVLAAARDAIPVASAS